MFVIKYIMGVKDLWNIITPLSERRPLYELHGKSVAIDLSGWIVDSQTVTDNHAQPKMYLRNLFFRTSFMLQQNIFPVCVLEGTAPDLKHKTMAKRNEIRSGVQSKINNKGNRSQFNAILRQCEEMLCYMGLFCLRSQGEAEALCAYLDQDGFVDGCISQDSDCFLYGAKKVYRNFCTKSQGNKATSQGSVDVYTIQKIEQVLNLGRNKMIALALLCGCDYNEGVPGIGKEAALKLFKTVKDEDILERLKSWRRDHEKFERLERKISDPNICNLCGHEGKMRSHLKKGCIDCGTNIKCNEVYKEKRTLINNELSMRKKALLIENFPDQDIIDEYLICKEKELSSLSLKWNQPKVHKFIDFMIRHLGWEPEYAFAKIFPLITQWQLANLPSLSLQQQKCFHFVNPKRIRKIRRRKGILCYEIVWKDEDRYFDGLMLTNTSDKEDEDDLNFDGNDLVSIETQELFAKCYPEMVEEFEESRKPKKKTTTRKRKAKTIKDNNRKLDEFIVKNPVKHLEKSLENLNISPKITPKRKKKQTYKNTTMKINPQISRVLETEKLDKILNGSLERMFNEITPEDFESDGEANMSAVINRICKNEIYEDCKETIFIEDENSEPEFIEDFKINECKDHFDNNLFNTNRNDEASMSETINRICGINTDDATTKNALYCVEDTFHHSFTEDGVAEIDLTQDEFEVDETYVPLRDRLRNENAKHRFSIGIDNLLNSTE